MLWYNLSFIWFQVLLRGELNGSGGIFLDDISIETFSKCRKSKVDSKSWFFKHLKSEKNFKGSFKKYFRLKLSCQLLKNLQKVGSFSNGCSFANHAQPKTYPVFLPLFSLSNHGDSNSKAQPRNSNLFSFVHFSEISEMSKRKFECQKR